VKEKMQKLVTKMADNEQGWRGSLLLEACSEVYELPTDPRKT
jgi:hypothetical protein